MRKQFGMDSLKAIISLFERTLKYELRMRKRFGMNSWEICIRLCEHGRSESGYGSTFENLFLEMRLFISKRPIWFFELLF